jgi:hydroxymethylpyrimidine/phosphomethylpyrimidine kinase
LTIAGSDGSAGAGIQADLKSIEANGGYAATVITAVTAQNTRGVRRVDRLPAESVRAQLDAVFDDLDVTAVKTGMLVDEQIVTVVAEVLERRRPRFFVCDPVTVSSSGDQLLDRAGVAALLARLVPLATVVTPNVDEVERLSGVAVRDPSDAERAGFVLLEHGARAVLVTGGHLAEAPATDVLVDASGSRIIAGRFVGARHTHGTGCVLASAIATRLACGFRLLNAIEQAKEFTTHAIRHGLTVGSGPGPVDPLFRLHTPAATDDGENRR